MTLLLALIALPGIAAVLLRWSTAMFASARYYASYGLLWLLPRPRAAGEAS